MDFGARNVCLRAAISCKRRVPLFGPIGDGQPVLGQCFDVRRPGSLSLLRRKRLCCLSAHVTQLKLPPNKGPARSLCVGFRQGAAASAPD